MSLVGAPAPNFRLPSTKNLNMLDEDVALADHRGRWVVLVFYPGDFTFVCPTEVLAFSQVAERFDELEADVIAISTDSVNCHQAWQEFALGKLALPLASDQTQCTCRDYGVLIEDEGVARRALFIVDPHGTVRYEVVHDQDTGRNVDEVLRVLFGLRTARRTPANWVPGEATLGV